MNNKNCPLKTHKPVLLKQTIESLQIKPDGFYIDCTLGEGGHSIEILKRLSSKGFLLSIDQDQNAIEFVKNFYPEKIKSKNWIIANENFSKLDTILDNIRENKSKKDDNAHEKLRKADGIIADLGLSSRQIEIENRGFSYHEDNQPLDMRMDKRLSVTARDLLYGLNQSELEKLFRTYGEEKYAKSIASQIKQKIEADGLETVGDLVKIIYKALPSKNLAAQKKHPARRVFQAVRIAVNDELNSLKELLEAAKKNLKSGGKLIIITFHSLEEKVVRSFLKRENVDSYKIIVPEDEELRDNPRASSAKEFVITL